MGRGGQGEKEEKEVKVYSWNEVREHSGNDKWLVIDGQVYNITDWVRKHPGGSRVISHYAGQDATDAFRAFHNDLKAVQKYLKPIHLGSVKPEEQQVQAIDRDFRELRKTAEKMDLFRPSYAFFFIHLAHIIAFEVLGYLVMKQFGTGWIPYLITLLCCTIVQAQSAWLQHDFGHLSVFKNMFKLDQLLHYFTMGFLKGASPHWWNHMHYQHHAKPNVIDKDPDVRVEALFVIGKQMPVKIAKSKKKSMPYNWQHHYFFIVGPPLLFPVYFQYMLLRHIFTRKLWLDLVVVAMFFARLFILYFPMLGWGVIPFYFTVRCLESHWFTWVAQSNHVPMDVKADEAEPWLKLQMHATCNVERSLFNDWFTGHLNFQIEHHLFPTMPRHNLYKIAPLVKSLCEKHGVSYQVKSLYGAFADIVKTLRHSGELWYSTYKAFHSS
ncbi:fatty acid desaturase 2-like isoform X1 [Pomacea canaliculata]|uniref:fatty acid desaturase 2-like isoform X1 n=1 Tax=Pomacea canaliculata TaxID=400727 RepID=UPI000D734BE1|nr:fatty acid desaturase 2-like isoform X1 [Pomacea canaliculata]XP_025080938.1 fatty acid desaturase 2-like isoform X1 [Pomacea canaliculata]XP_025081024.1 fatty acid desaturase 2-like isoform X1 [Pomacea canaliculata]XP_025081116.1 fatty acid desaturase 2-like isoform X1 [Pomacea canaliculata]XP_025081195.1 fatty acid desaturase 2-like isoform X1 [Pomacea canaliculata]XP_025081280.1 fatty acid desaturase 2-like isoform X1 [Pomacea canaliculata]XP_025081366.1 fatty acid desaturase 2-like iso